MQSASTETKEEDIYSTRNKKKVFQLNKYKSKNVTKESATSLIDDTTVKYDISQENPTIEAGDHIFTDLRQS